VSSRRSCIHLSSSDRLVVFSRFYYTVNLFEGKHFLFNSTFDPYSFLVLTYFKHFLTFLGSWNQQILNSLQIDLYHLNFHFKRKTCISVFRDSFEKFVWAHRYKTRIRTITKSGVRFTWTSLTISKYCSVETFPSLVKHSFTKQLPYFFLVDVFWNCWRLISVSLFFKAIKGPKSMIELKFSCVLTSDQIIYYDLSFCLRENFKIVCCLPFQCKVFGFPWAPSH